MKTKILIFLISCMLMASAASAKRIYEYTNLGALADADEFLVSDASDSNREFAVTGTVVKTYIGTNVALTLGDLSDLKIDIGASDEDLISATPADKDLQTYTATAIDTLLLSAGSAPTIQANDPTSASANGWYLATDSGDAFYKTTDGLFNISAGTYSPDPDFPLFVSASIPPAGDSITVIFDQDMVTSTSLGTWTVNGSTTGPLALDDPTCGTSEDCAFPILSGPILDGETVLLYYTIPAGNDGLEAADDATKLAGWATGKDVLNGSEQTPPSALTKSDEFTRANENPIAGNWTAPSGNGGLKIASGTVTTALNDGTRTVSYWSADTFGNDQCSSVIITASPEESAGPMVRVQSTGPLNNGYGAGYTRLYKYVASVKSTIGSIYTAATVGQKLTVCADGDVISAYIDDVSVATGNDATFSSGQPGITVRYGGSTLDAWNGWEL